MNHVDFALLLQEERDFIRAEMEDQNLTPHQIAGLANIGVPTVVGFINGTTFSPHYRTIVSMHKALGYVSVKMPEGSVIVIKRKKGRKRGRR